MIHSSRGCCTPEYPKRGTRLVSLLLVALRISISLAAILYSQLPSSAYLGDSNIDKRIVLQQSTQLFDGLSIAYSSSDTRNTTQVAWGDMDNDGDLDLAISNEWDGNQIYRNDDEEGFTIINLGGEVRNTQTVAWGDIDDDGDLDLIAGNGGNTVGQINQIYRNDGNNVFNASDLGTTAWNTRSIALGDMDGDNDLDIVVGNGGNDGQEINQLLLNDGQGVFTELNLGTESIGTSSIALGDLDQDGDLDIVVGNRHSNDQIYINDGSGIFASQDLPGTTTTNSISIGDLDSDGDMDIVAGLASFVLIYRNDGGLNFRQSFADTISGSVHGVALGDVDNDGDLDLAVSTLNVNRIYRNEGGGNFTSLQLGVESRFTKSLAWGDIDGDGDLDLSVGNGADRAANLVYRNDIITTFGTIEITPNDTEVTDIAWGDIENDGDIDLAIVYGEHCGDAICTNEILLNENGTFSTTIDISTGLYSKSVSWGDSDNDGDLDLAIGVWRQPDLLYRNDGQNIFTAITLTAEFSETSSIAWGDADNDGDLDLAVGIEQFPGGRNRIYRNEGENRFVTVDLGSAKRPTSSIAWGDADSDGDLDLAVGNTGNNINQLYFNNGNGEFTPTEISGLASDTREVAWGDLEGDGDLDLAVANIGGNRVYRNEGNGSFTSVPLNIAPRRSTGIDWGDVEGDGDLDLLVANLDGSQVFRNDGNGMFIAFDLETEARLSSVATWGDFDLDGDLDIATGSSQGPSHLHLNSRVHEFNLPNNPPYLQIKNPVTPTTYYYGSATIITKTVIPIQYTLYDQEEDLIQKINAYYSLDGGGNWQPAIASNQTNISEVATAKEGKRHTFYWDTFASGVWGASHNVVFKIEAFPSIKPSAHKAAGPFRYTKAAAQTQPFRIRGTQVRVSKIDDIGPNTVLGAIIYRIPSDRSQHGMPFENTNSEQFKTNNQGYLEGRGSFGVGDHLIALFPITRTANYTLYHTSPIFEFSEFKPYTVTQPGVQNLIVSDDKPLFLFNLDVSLEWDARNEFQYIADLKANLQEASRHLYDWSNGQAALGNITVYHNRQNWHDADIRIYATNKLRPSATIGGITDGLRFEKVEKEDGSTQSLIFTKGHVHMGAKWTKYGEAGENSQADWSRALAHELGHYLFFLLDNYIGRDINDRIINVQGCPGVMSNPYFDGNSEFHPDADWANNCSETLSQDFWGRADWSTLSTIYPALFKPNTAINDARYVGPSLLPLAVTQITEVDMEEPATGLEDPTFFLLNEDGSTYFASEQSQGILFQGDALIDLGTPRRDRIHAHGAKPGDTLCIYDYGRLPEPASVCETVNSLTTELRLTPQSTWRPEVLIKPTTPFTLAVQVSNVPSGLDLQAQLYPTNLISPTMQPTPISLQDLDGNGVYTGTLTTAQIALAARVHINNTSDSAQGTFVDYTLGGAPRLILPTGTTLVLNEDQTLVERDGTTLSLSDGSTLSLSDGSILFLNREGLTLSLSDGSTSSIPAETAYLSSGSTLSLSDGSTLSLSDGRTLSLSDGSTLSLSDGSTLSLSDGSTLSLSDGSAPIQSTDGQVTLYTDSLQFGWDEFYTIQSASVIPHEPSWATVIGSPVHVIESQTLIDSGKQITSSISFQYLGRNIDSEDEPFLHIYYFAEGKWEELETDVDPVHNVAVASSRGAGLYALMYSIEVILSGDGAAPIGYPFAQSMPITDAISSIADYDPVVHFYNEQETDLLKRWKIYDPSIPDEFTSLVNTLQTMSERQIYWISLTHSSTVTWKLKDTFNNTTPEANSINAASIPTNIDTDFTPLPATYYGYVTGVGATLMPDASIAAQIDEIECGLGQVAQTNGQTTYRITVLAGQGFGSKLGCGIDDSEITLSVPNQDLVSTLGWLNTSVNRQDIELWPQMLNTIEIYLPFLNLDE